MIRPWRFSRKLQVSEQRMFEACKTLCQCRKCKKWGNERFDECDPCESCNGIEYDVYYSRKTDKTVECGYRVKCPNFEAFPEEDDKPQMEVVIVK